MQEPIDDEHPTFCRRCREEMDYSGESGICDDCRDELVDPASIADQEQETGE